MNDDLQPVPDQASPQGHAPPENARLDGVAGGSGGSPSVDELVCALAARTPPPQTLAGANGATRTMPEPVRQSGGSPGAQHAPPETECQLRAVALTKGFQKGPVRIPVLRGVTLGIRRGEFLAVVGQSGSGKSTLLHLLGTLDSPDSGEIYFDGQRIDDLPGSCRDTLRNKHFGMIFQMYHLLPELTTLENVLAPLMIGHSLRSYLRNRREFRATAARVLDMVGLGHRLKHRPRELSGGEMQRAAIARALVANPRLLLADEPTGNLDHTTGREILEILASLNERQNLTIVMVTHDPAIARRAHRVVRLVDGRVEDV